MIVEPLELHLIISFIHNAFQAQFTIENSNPGGVHARKYIYGNSRNNIKNVIERDILDKIKSVYTIRRNPMYNLHFIRMGDSRYTKAKSSNNLLVITSKKYDFVIAFENPTFGKVVTYLTGHR